MTALIPYLFVALMFWFPGAYAAAAAWTAGGRPPSTWLTLADRADVVTTAATAATFLVVARALVPWDTVPPALWGVALFLLVLGLGLSALVWRDLPATRPGKSPGRKWAVVAGELVVVAVVTVLMA